MLAQGDALGSGDCTADGAAGCPLLGKLERRRTSALGAAEGKRMALKTVLQTKCLEGSNLFFSPQPWAGRVYQASGLSKTVQMRKERESYTNRRTHATRAPYSAALGSRGTTWGSPTSTSLARPEGSAAMTPSSSMR